MQEISKSALALLIALTLAGCSKHTDVSLATETARDLANEITSALVSEGAELRDGRLPASASGPTLESYRGPVRVLPDRPFSLQWRFHPDDTADITHIAFQLRDAEMHILVPVMPDAAGSATTTLTLPSTVDAVGQRTMVDVAPVHRDGTAGGRVPMALTILAEPDAFDFDFLTLAAHQGPVEAISFSEALDGTLRLATGGEGGDVTVWDAVEGRLQHRLAGHTDRVFDIASTRDTDVAVSGGLDESVRFWDLAAGVELAVRDDHEGAVRSIAVSADGSFAVTGSVDGTARVWDLATASLLQTLTFDDPVTVVCLSADGARLAVGSGRFAGVGEVAMLNTSDWTPVATLEDLDGEISALAFRSDGMLAVAFGRGSVWLVDANDGTVVVEFVDVPFDTVEDLGFPSGVSGVLMGLTLGGRMSFWDTASGERIALRRADNEMFAFSLSADGRRVGLGTGFGPAWVIDVADVMLPVP